MIERAVLLGVGRRHHPQRSADGDTRRRQYERRRRPTAQQLTLADLERRHIEAVLLRANWHQGRAATQLGISSQDAVSEDPRVWVREAEGVTAGSGDQGSGVREQIERPVTVLAAGLLVCSLAPDP